MKYLKIKPANTTVDHRYQRDLDSRRVEEIARAFNPLHFGVPVVSERNDEERVRIDGQHRCAGAIVAGFGEEEFLMEVHYGLSLQQEAEMYLRLNGGRTAVGAIDKYKARLVAEEPVALEIQAILEGLGCRITNGKSAYGIMAVQAVEVSYYRGPDNLRNTIKTLSTWLDGSPEAFEGELIRGTSAFFVAWAKEANPAHLASRLTEWAPAKLMARVKRESQVAAMGRSDAARLVLTEIYNHRTPRRLQLRKAEEF